MKKQNLSKQFPLHNRLTEWTEYWKVRTRKNSEFGQFINIDVFPYLMYLNEPHYFISTLSHQPSLPFPQISFI